MPTVKIVSRYDGSKVMFEHDVSEEMHAAGLAVRAALEAAVTAGANLARANLARADLAGANLAGANLTRADLVGANLAGADLAGANLTRADLVGANLAGANLAGADLAGAYLARADLVGADLAGAYLAGAYLAGADLAGAYLAGANNAGLAISRTRILPSDGELTGWKKCDNNVIVKLRIPAEAKRSHAFGRKCRAEFADVLEVIGADVGITTVHGPRLEYVTGKRVTPDAWDDNWQNECGSGIHFYITRIEAEAH